MSATMITSTERRRSWRGHQRKYRRSLRALRYKNKKTPSAAEVFTADSGAPGRVLDHAVEHIGGEALRRRMHAKSSAHIAHARGHMSRWAGQALRPPDRAGIENPIALLAWIDHAMVMMIFLDERVGAGVKQAGGKHFQTGNVGRPAVVLPADHRRYAVAILQASAF